jgi:phosphoribosylanthranilate isomerase
MRLKILLFYHLSRSRLFDMKIKVCGLRDETNFREVASLDLDFLGLIFIPTSTRYLDLEHAIKLSRIERGNTLLTGLFQNQDAAFICEVVQAAKLDCAQIYGEKVQAKDLKALLPHLKILKAVTVNALSSADPAGVDYFLVDNEQGGSGVKFDWNLLSNYQGDTPLIIAGGIGPDDVDAVHELAQSNPMIHGVDVSSRFEISVCYKDVLKIREFSALLRR